MDEVYGSSSVAWFDYLDRAVFADPVSPRGQLTYELLNAQHTILSPEAIIGAEGREWRYFIGAAEACGLVGQISVPEILTERFKAWEPFVEDGVLWGAYGPRIAGDLGQVVQLLRDDPDTRQAVLTIYDSSRDLRRNVPDVPCTIAIQFFIRDTRLQMRVVMRSNDLWLGYPYDTIQFFALQAAVAQALGIGVGSYTHSVGSMHLYERDLEKVAKLVRPQPIIFLPPYWNGETIGEISVRARAILFGPELKDMTEFERWLSESLDS